MKLFGDYLDLPLRDDMCPLHIVWYKGHLHYSATVGDRVHVHAPSELNDEVHVSDIDMSLQCIFMACTLTGNGGASQRAVEEGEEAILIHRL